MMIFWSILLIVVAVVLLRLLPGESRSEERDTPLERLQRRYAAGDLTTEEYEERKHRL